MTKNIDLFHDILIFLDVPVHTSETGFFRVLAFQKTVNYCSPLFEWTAFSWKCLLFFYNSLSVLCVCFRCVRDPGPCTGQFLLLCFPDQRLNQRCLLTFNISLFVCCNSWLLCFVDDVQGIRVRRTQKINCNLIFLNRALLIHWKHITWIVCAKMKTVIIFLPSSCSKLNFLKKPKLNLFII